MRFADSAEPVERRLFGDRGHDIRPFAQRIQHQGVDQRLLVFVVAVDRHRGDADLLGDVAHRKPIRTVPVESRPRGGQDLLFRIHVYSVDVLRFLFKGGMFHCISPDCAL